MPSGNFYCEKHKTQSVEIIKDWKKTVCWPGDVPYMYENDWSAISIEDMKLIASSTAGWGPWVTTGEPRVKIIKVNDSHWAWTENMPYELRAIEDIRKEEVICEIVGAVRKVNADSVETRESGENRVSKIYCFAK